MSEAKTAMAAEKKEARMRLVNEMEMERVAMEEERRRASGDEEGDGE